jgi:hypothetical protein
MAWITSMLAALAWSATPASSPAAGQPAAWEDYGLVLSRNIFSRDRSSPSRVRSGFTPRPTRPAEQSISLTGVAFHGEAQVAFLEDSRTGRRIQAFVGDPVDNGTVVSITLDSLEYSSDGATRKVYLGETLTGVAATFGPPSASSQPAPAATTEPAGTPGDTADPAINSVLERMRQRRLQQEAQ